MAQQMVNGSHYDGSTTITNPMSHRYAVISEPNCGKHHQKKPNKHGKTQPHWELSALANGTLVLPSRKYN